MDRSGSGDINQMDRYPVEQALRLKDEQGAEVVAVSMGAEQATEALRGALALGVDRAILISDPALAGSDLLGTSAALSALLDRERPDLVLFGQQTSDGGGALLWAAVAEHLQWPAVSQATALVIANGSARVTRQTEYGEDVIEAPLPTIVAVTDAINEPRYASLRRIVAAKRTAVPAVLTSDLGLDPATVGQMGSRTEVLNFGAPPSRPQGERIDDESTAAQAIVDFLVEKQIL
jgi:electron transfer flavoprotein beta subunit